MNCSTFLDLWNQRLDHPASAGPAELSAMEGHAASCATCRRLAAGFLVMAIRPEPPAVPDGFSDRVLAARESQAAPALPWWRPIRGRAAWAAGLAAAACAIAMVTIPRRGRDAAVPEAAGASPPARSWTSALADATSATLDLARETSAPAARVGQGVLGAAGVAEGAWPPSEDVPAPAPDVLQAVSRRVNAGVRPLSGSARRAFSFLVAPTSATAKPDSAPSPDSGA